MKKFLKKYGKDIILLIIGIIVGVLTTIWGTNYSNNLADRKNSELKEQIRPIVKVKFQELTDSTLRFDLWSDKDSTATINNLYFNFDIPGVLIGLKDEMFNKISAPSIIPRLLTGIGLNGKKVTTSETLLVNIKDINAHGNYSVTFLYKPIGQIYKENNLMTNGSFINLHDFCKLEYNWTFNGIDLTEKEYIYLIDLTYIKNDNQKLKQQFNTAYPDDSSIYKMEFGRKDRW